MAAHKLKLKCLDIKELKLKCLDIKELSVGTRSVNAVRLAPALTLSRRSQLLAVLIRGRRGEGDREEREEKMEQEKRER
eukprot:3768465-Rhodomonas_salina.1